MLEVVATMPGCLSYIVAKDTGDANAIWITEAWDSKASHEGSLSLPSVKAAIAKGRPLIAGFSDRVVTTPVGGLARPSIYAAKRFSCGPGAERRDPTKQFYIKMVYFMTQ